jgi:hypothetical protein
MTVGYKIRINKEGDLDAARTILARLGHTTWNVGHGGWQKVYGVSTVDNVKLGKYVT